MINEQVFRLKKNGEPNCNCFCRNPELIENYEKAIADATQTWECHHRMEKYFPRKTLIAIGWYWDCEPEELIFLTRAEHNSLHKKGHSVTEETKQKMSEAKKGNTNAKGKVPWNKGKRHSEETKRKMSESLKGQNKGKHWKLIDGKRVWY